MRDRLRAALPAGRALPAADWERHHAVVVRVLVALSLGVPLYSALRGLGVVHVVGHAAPLVLLTLAARQAGLSRTWRATLAATGLMAAAALVVHVAHGATEAHFMFFALVPLAALYAAWTPFMLAVGFVAVHHVALGVLVPSSLFDAEVPALGMAGLHTAFVLVESVACMVTWRLFEVRRELIERRVLEKTAELGHQRDALARMAAVVESTDDAVITMSPQAVIVTWNPGAERLYGHTAAEATGQHITMLIPPEGRERFGSTFRALAGASSLSVESRHVRKDGSLLEASVTVSNIRDEAGQVTATVAICRDISERKRIEAEARETARKLGAQAEELTRLALHDPLTGLANRALLHDRLRHALGARDAGRIAVLLLDLDDFKSVNDVSGHAVGDRLLIEVAERLRSAVRPTDTVARLGGDEFVVILDPVEDPSEAAAVADRILTALAVRIEIGEEHFLIDASLGIAVADDPERRDATELLRDADIAMYAAKGAGRGRHAIFEADMHQRFVAHTALVRDLRDAVATGQMRVLYQPQVDLSSGCMTGVEALVRWEHPDRGLLSPDRFIPVAESTGMIVGIDDWVLREACTQVRAWDAAGVGPLHMAVNISARRLVTGDLAGTIAAIARETMVEPARLELEITETVAIDHEPDAVETIGRVRALGVRVAIDDFGMGHSALSRLQTFPVDRLKIDRSFVAPLTHGAERGSIADAMIALGQSLGLQVIAEGVETDEHLGALRALGCGAAQGYLFSKPVPASAIEQLARMDTLLPSGGRQETRGGAALAPRSRERERLIRSLLAELQRVTDLETTYVTHIDWDAEVQHVTHARNAGAIDIPEGLSVDWEQTLCRRALQQGVTYTDDVAGTFPGSSAAQDLDLQTYVGVPLLMDDGAVAGTLCGASSRRVALGPDTIKVMERFAQIISG